MTSTRLSLVILGFVVTCAAGMRNLTSGDELNKTSRGNDSTPEMSSDAANSTITTILIITTLNTTSMPSTNSTTNQTSSTNSTSTTNQTSSTTGKPSPTMKTDDKKLTTPRPIGTTKAKPTTTKNNKDSVKPNVATAGSSNTGIIILIVIIILAAVFVGACCWTRRRGRRYSVDPTSRADDVNIPLSAVEPTDPPADPVPHNGLQTFESAQSSSKEPEVTSEAQEEQKAEADKSAVEPSAESASPAPAPAPAPDSSEDKPKEVAAEQSPPAPVEPSTGEKAHDEGPVSTNAPVEPLNENNSNNAATVRDLKENSMFWDVPLHSPV